MKIRNKTLDHKIQEYLDRQFEEIKETQHLFETKEELFMNLKERSMDLIKNGKEEEEAFQEAIVSMGNLSSLAEEMRQYGEDPVKQSIYSRSQERVSTMGIVIGVLLTIFGFCNSAMVFFMSRPLNVVVGSGFLFIMLGISLITYSVLTRETQSRFAMNKIRALLYTVAISTIIFGFFTSAFSYSSTRKVYVAIAACMVFVLIGVGMYLYLMLTEKSRLKENK
ncbi:cation transport ATPase [Croceifilum oryzae]|uniref:Cation transport ATPase n=1 Tax=Croceifilum oryzae TaxID=1553429 RepID=A0AAJ1TIN3_9BACL|nr:permease prefix domain 1-containing protein [Croceifilum oryzae]MDQ0417242.1 cation transport ATPase [Croceifilum oryzae]